MNYQLIGRPLMAPGMAPGMMQMVGGMPPGAGVIGAAPGGIRPMMGTCSVFINYVVFI